MKRIWQRIAGPIKEYYIGYKSAQLKERADRWREETGIRFFVVKIAGRMTIISKRDFKKLRLKGYIKGNVTFSQMKQKAFYSTRP